MPSILNSDDGVVSGTSGLKTTGGNDGLLNIQSNGSTVVAVTGSGISVTGTVSQTGVSTFAAGTVSAPSITFTGDTNTGIFSPAADTIAFAEGGAEAMRIDSSGRVGIGQTSPSSYDPVARNLVIGNASGNTGLTISSGNANSGWIIFADGTAGTASYIGYIEYNHSDNSMRFITSAGERARFNSTGALVLAGGTTTANGIGITFPATQSASSDANTLDDYEEGAWTPIDGSGAGLTFAVARGRYTKIGREVICYMVVTYPSTANGNNSVIGGLPFTSADPYGGGADVGFGGTLTYSNYNANYTLFGTVGGTTVFTFSYVGARITNATLSDKTIEAFIKYFV